MAGTIAALDRWLGATEGAELADALAFLGWPIEAETLATVALAVAVGSALVAGTLAALLPGTVIPMVVVLVGAVAGYAVRSVPRWLAETRRVRALGTAPDLVALAVLRAQIDPAPERAAAFAAEHARDPLAASLAEHATRARGAPGSGWQSFGATWRAFDPSLGRAVALLGAAFEAPAGDRERLLDRSLDAALDGARDRMASFAAAVRGPTTAIYAFGVVVPLALVAALPAVRAAGLTLPFVAVVAVYDLLLPVALVAAGAWLLGKQPAAFPAAPVSRDHPDVPDRRLLGTGAGLLAGTVAWVCCPVVAPAWARWVVAPAWAIGVALVVLVHPVVSVRKRVAAVEAGLADALALAGQHVARGAAVETAVAAVGRELDGPTAERFAAAAGRQRRLGVDAGTAFVGEDGTFADLPSPRTRGAVSLLALAGREGERGGRVLVELADHVEELLAVEREARRTVADTVGTLRSTACCFAPLIGGTTVALAGRIGSLDAGPVVAVPTGRLGVAVGVYVVLLAGILAALAAALDRGLDRSRLTYQAGIAVLSAATVYPVALRATDLLV